MGFSYLEGLAGRYLIPPLAMFAGRLVNNWTTQTDSISAVVSTVPGLSIALEKKCGFVN